MSANESSLGNAGKSGGNSSDDIELSVRAIESRNSAEVDTAIALFSSNSPSYDAVDRFDRDADSNATSSTGVGSYDTSSSSISSSNRSGRGACCDTFSHALVTLLLLLLPFGVATNCPGVEVVWGLCGSSVGVLLALTFPAGIYLKLRGHKVINSSCYRACLSSPSDSTQSML